MQTEKTRRTHDFVHKHFLSYVYYRLKDSGLTYKEITFIVNMYQDELFNDLIKGNSVVLLKGLGTLTLEKYECGITINKDGSVKNNYPINFPKTLEFWKENPEYKNKHYIRCTNEHTNGYTFSLRYRRTKNGFPLNIFYTFKKNRILVQSLAKELKYNKLDARLGKTY